MNTGLAVLFVAGPLIAVGVELLVLPWLLSLACRWCRRIERFEAERMEVEPGTTE